MGKESRRNKLISKEGRQKGIQDKRDIERSLSGYAQRKDKIRKAAHQKIFAKKFREKAKEDALKEEERKEKVRDEMHKDFRNQEKRRKLKSKNFCLFYSKAIQKCVPPC